MRAARRAFAIARLRLHSPCQRDLISTCPTIFHLPPWCADRVATLRLACTGRSGLFSSHKFGGTLNSSLHTSPHHMPDPGDTNANHVNHAEQTRVRIICYVLIISIHHNLILAPIPSPWYHIRSSHLPNRTPTVALAAILSVPPKAPLTSS